MATSGKSASTELRSTASGPRRTVVKHSISLRPELAAEVAEAVERENTSLSAFVADALAHRLRTEHLRELVASDESELGPASERVREEIRAEWPA